MNNISYGGVISPKTTYGHAIINFEITSYKNILAERFTASFSIIKNRESLFQISCNNLTLNSNKQYTDIENILKQSNVVHLSNFI
jgi:hypothetical protein